MCRQVNFPRSPRIRKRWLLRRFAELAVYCGLVAFLGNQVGLQHAHGTRSYAAGERSARVPAHVRACTFAAAHFKRRQRTLSQSVSNGSQQRTLRPCCARVRRAAVIASASPAAPLLPPPFAMQLAVH